MRRAPGPGEELIGLEEALSQLPEQQRRAVLLRDWRGLSYDEVAAQLGVSRAAVETLIFRGRRTLAELLREEPRTTRRRLRSLGDLGSLFSAIKAALTGGAAATKIAATAVTVAALSGAGAIVGTSGHGAGSAPVDAPATKPAAAGLVASIAPAPRREVQSQARPQPAAKKTSPATRSALPRAASPSTAAQPTTAAAAPVATAPAGDASAPTPPSSDPHGKPHATPAPVAAAPPIEKVLPAVTEAVEQAVAPLLPILPVTVPPVTVPPIDVPPVTITVPPVAVPPIVSVPPVTVTLPPVTLPPIVVSSARILP